ncbi:MAG: aminopeptidase [Bacteroidaceae bacterium]|nr:aminopeptidase [Bacteroidaceae bacterium]
MMRRYSIGMALMLAMVLTLGGCKEGSDRRYDEGVSVELAQWRKETIGDLRYALRFSIPEQRSEAVEGEASIRFTLAQRQEVVLDFRESAERIHEVRVNGVVCDYAFANEHIIVPRRYTHKGDNCVEIAFTAGEQSLNRNEEYLYTLLVPDRARTVFPCFEQPNLKAEFTLELEVPEAWEAVSNTEVKTMQVEEGRKLITFKPTEPLSTYLFSFVAGKLQRAEYQDGERTIVAYHREVDERKVAQLEVIFEQVASSLHWLEEYTGIAYPFAKYSLIILPGFQYGGMEHTGATLYNDTRMFLSEYPTLDEELSRTELIAHETAHMWFGDYVTMAWFDDVWTKEVFANYFAARITEPLFPEVNHELNSIKNYTASALSEDRTAGTNAIRQQLDNLRNAGLIYGNIIYNKAPVMMNKLVEIMGEEAFREGIHEYLTTFAYGNATWDDLIAILDARSDEDLKAFSEVWVNRKGMPHIAFAEREGVLEIVQRDPLERSLVWPQRFAITFVGDGWERVEEVDLSVERVTMPIPEGTQLILPNTDGRGYGLFIPTVETMAWLLAHWHEVGDDTARQSLLMTLHENYQAGLLGAEAWLQALLEGLPSERNELVASTLCGYLGEPLREVGTAEVEALLWQWSEEHALASCRLQLMRSLIANARAPKTIAQLYAVWEQKSHPTLSERDYTNLAYELALHMPERHEAILDAQRARIVNPDRIREFDFVAQAVKPDTAVMDSVFAALLKAENRRIEPWAEKALTYLNHPLREEYAVKYIRPGLEAMQEVQRTGDIFFPKKWARALLRYHRSDEARREVEAFFAAHPDYPELLKSKILQSCEL